MNREDTGNSVTTLRIKSIAGNKLFRKKFAFDFFSATEP